MKFKLKLRAQSSGDRNTGPAGLELEARTNQEAGEALGWVVGTPIPTVIQAPGQAELLGVLRRGGSVSDVTGG